MSVAIIADRLERNRRRLRRSMFAEPQAFCIFSVPAQAAVSAAAEEKRHPQTQVAWELQAEMGLRVAEEQAALRLTEGQENILLPESEE